MKLIDDFISFIKTNDSINNKELLISLVLKKFPLTKDRTVYYCKEFAVRFNYSSSSSFSNTVLSLSKLQKYDDRPFLICLVTKEKNEIYLANSTFLSKISHSSQDLSVVNIKGSFNGSDIMKKINEINNNRDNIMKLYAIHSEMNFDDNLPRIVEATNDIVPTGRVFQR